VKAILCLFAFIATAGLSQHAEAQSVQRVTSVISGKLARAGSSNRKPYDDAALKGLCEQGYTLAIYVYPGAKNRSVSCSRGSIQYVGMTNWSKPESIVPKIAAEAARGGKTMVHCWYGVHASNLVTSAALVKMCGMSGDAAADVFRKGVPKGSLNTGRIEELAAKIEKMSPGGSRVSGCP
jgi:hypothetical protein